MVALSMATVDCRCPREASRRGAEDVESVDAEFDLPAESDASALPRCTMGPPVVLAARAARDGGSADERFEAVHARSVGGGDLGVLVDRDARTLSLVRPRGGRAWTAPVGASAIQALSLAALGRDSLVLAVSEERGARVQRAYLATGEGGALTLRATHAGSLEEGARVVSATVRDGALSAWDETLANHRGVVRVQRWTAGFSADPPSVIVSAPEHDASDPVLAGLADGGALLAYLAVHNVASERETANQSTADIVLRALQADGSPRGAAVTLTPLPRMRFGVALHVTEVGRWAAWRVALDSDHEGLGDGGQVAIVALGDDLRPLREPAYVSERGAVPTGAIAMVSDGSTVEVYWVERRGDAVMTVRRAVGRDGRVEGPSRDEPAFGGAIPFGGDARAPRALVDGPEGLPSIAVARCP